jgi:hypothetical protein
VDVPRYGADGSAAVPAGLGADARILLLGCGRALGCLGPCDACSQHALLNTNVCILLDRQGYRAIRRGIRVLRDPQRQ